MTDLSSLFRTSPQIQTVSSPFQKYNEPKNSLFTATSPQYQNYYQSNSWSRQSRPSDTISSQAKKIITYNSMQAQATWFEQNNILQCLTKIFIIWIVAGIAFFFNWISLNIFLGLIIFVFLMFGLQHNMFGTGLFKKWAYCSLFGTTLVFVNQIFLFLVNKISSNVASELFFTHQSLVPSLYITIILMIFLYSQPLMSYTKTPSTIIQIFLTFPKSLHSLGLLLYQLKIVIASIYSIMQICTFLISLILESAQGDWNNVVEFCGILLHPVVIAVQFITFVLMILLIHFSQKFIGLTIQNLAISGFYGKKNQNTKLPYMLQLLRISPNNVFNRHKFNFKQPSILLSLKKFLNIDFAIFPSAQTKFGRQQLQNIYKHSLKWLIDILNSNPNALNTRINTSKFYNTYFDIFKEFVQPQLLHCSSSLFELQKNIQNLDNFRDKHKSIKEDFFCWAKILKKQFEVWQKSIQCFNILSIANLILQIISLANIQSELWRISSIGVSFEQIKDKAGDLSKNKSLNSVIRNIMQQYHKKTNALLKK